VFCVCVLIHCFNSPGWNASLQGTFSREKITSLLPLFSCYMIAFKEMLLQVKVVWNLAGSSLAHIKMHDALPIKKKKFTNDPVARFSSSCSVVQECLFMPVVTTSMLFELKRSKVDGDIKGCLRTAARTTDLSFVWNVNTYQLLSLAVVCFCQ